MQNTYTSADVLIGRYIELRQAVAEAKAEFDEKKSKLNAEMEEIAETLRQAMANLGVESLKTPKGTAYIKEVTSVTTEDKSAFLDFIIANEMWELLDIRPSKAGVQEFAMETGDLPPGIDIRRVQDVGFRRA